MFANLAERLQDTFKKMRGKGRLTEADVNEALREVRPVQDGAFHNGQHGASRNKDYFNE
jgi:signal recognition particle subunit SRP54